MGVHVHFCKSRLLSLAWNVGCLFLRSSKIVWKSKPIRNHRILKILAYMRTGSQAQQASFSSHAITFSTLEHGVKHVCAFEVFEPEYSNVHATTVVARFVQLKLAARLG